MSMPGRNAAQGSNTFTYKVGQYEVITLSEGQGQGNKSILIGALPEMLEKYAPAGTFPNGTHAFLVKSEGRNILVDAGYGRNLFANLEAVGVAPEKIDGILITHSHGDHIGGLLRDGKAAFPTAHLYMSKAEYDFSQAGERNAQARTAYAAYEGRTHLFEPGAVGSKGNAIVPGITPFAAYGHTPGHTAFLIEGRQAKLLIWGDLTHAMAIQMPCPEVAVTYDSNPQDAIKARKETLEYVAKNKIPVAGMHIPFPGIGTVESGATPGGYLFTPAK